MAKTSITLKEWIAELGVNEVAKLMRVTPTCIRHWRRGYVLPTDAQKVRIKRYTKGKIDLEQMVLGHYSPSNKNRRNA